MAEAKRKQSRSAASKRNRGTAAKAKSRSGSSKSRTSSSKSRNGSSGSRSGGSSKQRSQPRARSAQGKPAAVADVVEEKAKDAGKTVGRAGKGVGRAVKKARVPLLASGAAIAGVAGGAALASRQAHRHGGIGGAVRKLDSDDVAKAARRVGDVSARVGQFAADFQRAREASNGSGNGRHRSPVEVVLQGLTTRH